MNNIEKEKPFEYLRRKNGECYTSETIRNWYIARAFVLDKLKDVCICQGMKERLHVVINGDSPLMLSVARQVALSAHYANFDERHHNRSVITIVSKDAQTFEELQKEEYLCNLPRYCKCSVNGTEPINSGSYIDLEIQLVETWNPDDALDAIVMTENDVKNFVSTKNEDDIFNIDTRKAVLAQRIYSLGSWIDNLPAENIHDVERYAMALNVFKHNLLKKPTEALVDEKLWKNDLTIVKTGLSNIFCTDCFESTVAGLKLYGETHDLTEDETMEHCIESISKCEHSRWVVEKLIMGFRPLNEQERLIDERSFGNKKFQYRNELKKNAHDPAHIDLCSFAELRRINPSDLKYDSFLMLAMPDIVKQCKP